MSQRAFWQVAEEGLGRLDEGENPNLPFGKITDPALAFQVTVFMLALWATIQDAKETTKLWALREPECIDERTFVLHGNPLESVRDILTEVLALAKRIKRNGEMTYEGHAVPHPASDITLRVKIFRTEIDVTAESDIDELVAKHDAQLSDPIPVFGGEQPDGVVGSGPVTIR